MSASIRAGSSGWVLERKSAALDASFCCTCGGDGLGDTASGECMVGICTSGEAKGETVEGREREHDDEVASSFFAAARMFSVVMEDGGDRESEEERSREEFSR